MQNENEVPGYILTSLEDLASQMVDLEELMLAIAASAQYLSEPIRIERPDTVN